MTTDEDWETRLTTLWDQWEQFDELSFLDAIARLTAELPADDPRAPFEMAGAHDAAGHEDLAVPLYRQALAAGLAGSRRRQAIIQLASSMRNLGQLAESVELLTAERTQQSDDLDDAVAAFLALALVDSGREREAVSVALGALAPHLHRYQRSVGDYARELIEPNTT